MYTCTCIYIYMYMYTCTYIHLYVYICTFMHTYIYIYTHTCIFTCMQRYKELKSNHPMNKQKKNLWETNLVVIVNHSDATMDGLMVKQQIVDDNETQGYQTCDDTGIIVSPRIARSTVWTFAWVSSLWSLKRGFTNVSQEKSGILWWYTIVPLSSKYAIV